MQELVANCQEKPERARRVYGHPLPLAFNHGGSDAACFTARGIPVMLSGVVGANHHQDGEYVEIPSLVKYAETVRSFIVTWP